MKRTLLVIFALCMLFSLFGCSSTEEEFHFDLIAEYDNSGSGEQYYKDTVNGVQIIDFGVKFGAKLYDVEPSNDNELTYYYKYEGRTEKEKGFSDLKAYIEYFDSSDDTFTRLVNAVGYSYEIKGVDGRLLVTYVSLTQNAVGLLVSVSVPTEGIKGENRSIDPNIVKSTSQG